MASVFRAGPTWRASLRWWVPKPPSKPEPFDPADTVVQIKPFREVPRWDRERDLSVVAGELSLPEAIYEQFGRLPKRGDRIRHIDVADLHRCGYWAYPSPTDEAPKHGSVSAPIALDMPLQEHQHWWDDERRTPIVSFARIVPKEATT